MTTNDTPSCAAAREGLHRALDGETLDAAERRRWHAHRSECEPCRRLEQDLRKLQERLRGATLPALPDDVVTAVLARTSRAATGALPARRAALDWRVAAIAASLLLAATLGGLALRAPRGPSKAEIARAEVEARAVLRLTSRALERSRRAALGQVLAGEVSPALQRVPARSAGPGGRPTT